MFHFMDLAIKDQSSIANITSDQLDLLIFFLECGPTARIKVIDLYLGAVGLAMPVFIY